MVAPDIDTLRSRIKLPVPASAAALPNELRLYADSKLEIFYVPTEHQNPAARLILLGLTPGFGQAQKAFKAFAEAIDRGASVSAALGAAKHSAAFAGSMRKNLCSMLDQIGLPAALEVVDAAALFVPPQPLVHLTSALRYPVFVVGRKNYSGTPRPTEHPELLRTLETELKSELSAVPSALIIPLGKATESATDHLISRGDLDPARVLRGFPHPSGANGHRKAQFEAARSSLQQQVARWFK